MPGRVVRYTGTHTITQEDAMTTTAVQTRRQTGYDADNRCTTCGEHIADPHAPGCPWDDVERDLADAARLALLEAASWT